MFGYDVFLSEHPEFQALRRRRNEARAAAFYAAAKPLREALTAGVRLTGQAVEALRRWRLQREVVGDLSALSDRMLSDIGVARSDIRGIARDFARRSLTEATAAELAPAQSAQLSKVKIPAQPAELAPKPRRIPVTLPVVPQLQAIEDWREMVQRPRVLPRAANTTERQQAAAGCG